MKPRPPVICLLNNVTTPSESWPPARPAKAPAITVEKSRSRRVGMPAARAASSLAPVARSSMPSGVRNRRNDTRGMLNQLRYVQLGEADEPCRQQRALDAEGHRQQVAEETEYEQVEAQAGNDLVGAETRDRPRKDQPGA